MDRVDSLPMAKPAPAVTEVPAVATANAVAEAAASGNAAVDGLVREFLEDAFLAKDFYTIGALKTNRVIFPAGIKRQISQFAPYIHKTDPNVSLVTVGTRQYYVYRYEGNLNDLENATV